MSLLAGVTNLATDVTQVDHNYGWVLVIIGVIAIPAGVILLLLPSGQNDDDGKRITEARTEGGGSIAQAAGRDIINVQQTQVPTSATATDIQTDDLIRATPSQASSLRPTGQGGATVWEVVAYLDVATADTTKPLRNCRVKLLDLHHHMAYTDRNIGQVVERWDRDAFSAGQTYFFSWSGRHGSIDAVDIHSKERSSIARCLGTRTELTTTAGAAGHIFHGDQYHLIVEITADNSRPVTREYWLRMHQGKSAVIEEWDDSRTTWL